MSNSKNILFNSYKDVNDSEVKEYFQFILENYEPKKKILLLVQCSKIKPYSESISHSYIRKAISELTGYDPKDNPEKNPLEIIVISSLIGPVPYEFEKDYIPTHYNLSVNKINNSQFEEIKPILVQRLFKFLVKVRESYDHIIFFVKNKYRILAQEVIKKSKMQIPILPTRDLHMIREAWIELKFYLLKILKNNQVIQPISKTLLYDIISNRLLRRHPFSVQEFIEILKMDKTRKQAINYISTLKKLDILNNIKKKIQINPEFIKYIQIYEERPNFNIKNQFYLLREFFFINSELKYNFKYILYELYLNSTRTIKQLSRTIKINKFSMNLYLNLLMWMSLIKKSKNRYFLTTDAKEYLGKEKFLKLLDKKIRITDNSF